MHFAQLTLGDSASHSQALAARSASHSDVAVVIPTARPPSLLVRALGTIAAQTLPPKEVFVVVDNPEVLGGVRDAVGEFGRFPWAPSVLCTEGGTGPSRARNLGARAASASYLAFLDDDDEFSPRKVEVITSHFASADLICHAIRWVIDDGAIQFVQRPGKLSVPEIFVENTVGAPTAVAVRRAAFISVGGFREDMPALEDYELWLRLATAGARLVSVDDVLGCYTVRLGDGARSNNTKNDAAAWALLHSAYAATYSTLGMRQWSRHRQYIFRGRMHRNRGAGRRWRAAGWAALAAIRFPSPDSIRLIANAITLPLFGFGVREALLTMGRACRTVALAAKAHTRKSQHR